jgi:hypothetical protein
MSVRSVFGVKRQHECGDAAEAATGADIQHMANRYRCVRVRLEEETTASHGKERRRHASVGVGVHSIVERVASI